MSIYQPAEDSYLLSKSIKKIVKNKKIKSLDMGSGSGIQARTLIDLGVEPSNITLVDINPEAIKYLKNNFQNCSVIKSNLFQKIKGKYDLIVFNPPYLPNDKNDKEKDTSGGKKGDETILKFLKPLKKYLNEKGKCLLLTSSYTPMERINKEFKNYRTKIIAHVKIFYEELYVYEICLKK